MTNSTGARNVVIIGSGPAGLTAAIYASRAMLKPVVIAGFISGGPAGGQLMYTTEVENYPGYKDGVMGPEMMADFKAQAARFGTEFMEGADVIGVDLSKRPFTIHLDGEEAVSTKAIIVATGASANWLGIPGEETFKNRGVSACATCDGALPLFRDKELIVIGGGDTAMEEAQFLTKYASKVYIVHRRDELRASKIMQERAFKNPKIEFVWNSAVKEIKGDKTVSTAVLFNSKTGETTEKTVAGVFMAIGHTPNTKIFNGQLETDASGYLILKNPPRTYTSIEGVFAAGDVADHTYRQAVTAAGTGCAAAIDCERWLEATGQLH